MYNPDEIQNDTNRAFNSNNEGLSGNFIPENNNPFENEQGQEQYQQSFPNQQNQQSHDDNSLHIDKMIDDYSRNQNFIEKEKKISEQLNNIFQKRSGLSIDTFATYIFMINKILLLTTFTEFIFQRFDVVTLLLCIVIIFIELEIFQKKHLYKWLMVLCGSLLLDALVLIDISPVRKNINN